MAEKEIPTPEQEEISKLVKWIRKVFKPYQKMLSNKHHLDLFIAVLTIPVLLTAIIINVTNLKMKSATATAAPTPQIEKQVIYVSPSGSTNPETVTKTVVVTPTPDSTSCMKGIGPVSIDSPSEGANITDNPVTIDVNYQQGNYCAAVWSYQINGGNWSSYDDQSISLYNLPNGQIHLTLRVKSIVTGQTETITRNFTYTGTTVPTPTVDNNNNQSSSSAH